MSINSSQLMKLIRNRNNNPFVYHFFFFFSFFFSSLSSLSYVSSSARGGKERMHREVPDAIQLLAFQSLLCNQPLCVCLLWHTAWNNFFTFDKHCVLPA